MTGRLAFFVVLAALGPAVAGCGSSSSPSSSSDGASAKTASAASATVTTMNVAGYGKVLAASGRPLYLLSADPAGASKCSGACAEQWPPAVAHGAPTAGPGVKPSLLTSFKRSDGTEQLAYAKHALYTHKGRGLVSGAGTHADGGTWYLVSPAGTAITTTASGGY